MSYTLFSYSCSKDFSNFSFTFFTKPSGTFRLTPSGRLTLLFIVRWTVSVVLEGLRPCESRGMLVFTAIFRSILLLLTNCQVNS